MKILLVEDDNDLREVTEMALRKERYIVETAPTLRLARQKALIYEYDCILLDIMLPDGCGLDLLRSLRQAGRAVPGVIILSAKDSIDDKVEGLNLGADDYLPKPFHLAELHARIKSVMRRRHREGGLLLQAGNVTAHPDTFLVEVDGKPLPLGRK